jgi:O-antigen/teichoic acid export membrane protein
MERGRKKTIQSLFKGGSIVFVGLGLELGVSFFAKVLMARLLGQVDYGVATLGITTISFSSAILLLGLNNGVGRYLPRFDNVSKRKGVILSAMETALPISILVGAVLALFAGTIASTVLKAPEATGVLRAAGVGIPFAVLLKLFAGVVQGMEQTVPKVLVRNMLQPVVRFGLITAVLLAGLGSLAIVWSYTATFAVAGLVGLWYILTRTPVLEQAKGVRIHRELVWFSAPLMLMTTMVMLLSNLDIFFLSYFHTSGDIGLYNVIYPLAELLTMTLSGFSFIFLPTFSRLHADSKRREMNRIYQVVTKWVFLLTFPGLFFFLLFPGVTIAITFGPEYSEGIVALTILSLGFFVQSVAGPNMNALTSIGATRAIMIMNLIAAGANIGLNYLLIPPYSYVGAAVATAISYTLLNLLYSAALYSQTGIHPLTTHLLKPATGALVLMGVTYALLSTVLVRTIPTAFGTFAAFLVVYTVTVLRLGAIQEEEVMLLRSIEERFGIDLTGLKTLADRLMG